MEKVYMLL